MHFVLPFPPEGIELRQQLLYRLPCGSGADSLGGSLRGSLHGSRSTTTNGLLAVPASASATGSRIPSGATDSDTPGGRRTLEMVVPLLPLELQRMPIRDQDPPHHLQTNPLAHTSPHQRHPSPSRLGRASSGKVKATALHLERLMQAQQQKHSGFGDPRVGSSSQSAPLGPPLQPLAVPQMTRVTAPGGQPGLEATDSNGGAGHIGYVHDAPASTLHGRALALNDRALALNSPGSKIGSGVHVLPPLVEVHDGSSGGGSGSASSGRCSTSSGPLSGRSSLCGGAAAIVPVTQRLTDSTVGSEPGAGALRSHATTAGEHGDGSSGSGGHGGGWPISQGVAVGALAVAALSMLAAWVHDALRAWALRRLALAGGGDASAPGPHSGAAEPDPYPSSVLPSAVPAPAPLGLLVYATQAFASLPLALQLCAGAAALVVLSACLRWPEPRSLARTKRRGAPQVGPLPPPAVSSSAVGGEGDCLADPAASEHQLPRPSEPAAPGLAPVTQVPDSPFTSLGYLRDEGASGSMGSRASPRNSAPGAAPSLHSWATTGKAASAPSPGAFEAAPAAPGAAGGGGAAAARAGLEEHTGCAPTAPATGGAGRGESSVDGRIITGSSTCGSGASDAAASNTSGTTVGRGSGPMPAAVAVATAAAAPGPCPGTALSMPSAVSPALPSPRAPVPAAPSVARAGAGNRWLRMALPGIHLLAHPRRRAAHEPAGSGAASAAGSPNLILRTHGALPGAAAAAASGSAATASASSSPHAASAAAMAAAAQWDGGRRPAAGGAMVARAASLATAAVSSAAALCSGLMRTASSSPAASGLTISASQLLQSSTGGSAGAQARAGSGVVAQMVSDLLPRGRRGHWASSHRSASTNSLTTLAEAVGGGAGGAGGGAGGAAHALLLSTAEAVVVRKQAFSDLPQNAGRVQVLSVDDEPVNQQVMRALLWAAEYEVLEARSGEEALDIVRGSEVLPDLVLLDVTLGGDVSGFEVCREIRREYSPGELPVIMITCSSLEEDVIRGLAVGANDYMIKPLRNLELMARIKTQLALRRSIRVAAEARVNMSLLASILPANVIRQLKQGVTLIAQFHQEVTILFSDIRGFTNLATEWPTEQIILMLNNMFTAFDRLCEQQGVYKVETIGDAYMIVSGHDGVADHAPRMLRMAAQMLTAVSDMRGFDGRELQIRVGIHTGPAHSGVVGLSRPRYCFFGDTVNT
ncbi:hypothetical protein GPECTOR_51g695 [Gonium pectorale]|uniref:Guanylate cyclase n=1 Tax=Gonium pectorale TaxID=33097 RepID=A0A150G770_GONPE|nr:hypothetical protein GPECTOR_51g695 [Gonium pectorale]|eukprot:KXZ45709.1 hypothetical protein GPECTOR_51g695 [Gonium pectorale]